MSDIDLSDPALKEAYLLLYLRKTDSNKTNWAVFGYVPKSYKLRLVETGEGGIEEFSEELNKGQVGYGFVRLETESGTTKFIYISWAPEGVPITQSILYAHTDAVAKFLPAHHAHVNARTEEVLAKEIKTVLWRLR